LQQTGYVKGKKKNKSMDFEKIFNGNNGNQKLVSKKGNHGTIKSMHVEPWEVNPQPELGKKQTIFPRPMGSVWKKGQLR